MLIMYIVKIKKLIMYIVKIKKVNYVYVYIVIV